MRIVADRCHVGIYELIKVLIEKQNIKEKEMVHHLNQVAIPKKKKKITRDREAALTNLKRLFNDGMMPLTDYLHGIAMNTPLK